MRKPKRWFSNWLMSACVACLAVGGVLDSHAAEAAAGLAQSRALLIGVSSYPSLEEHYQLHGPRNDVQRMRQVLRQRGYAADNISVLADGVDGARPPTRDNILKALGDLAQTAKPGETIFLLLAGHGSQQPADTSSPEGRQEADGLTEIFLPMDVGKWDGRIGAVKNAITKYELRSAVDRMLARGAFVWGVFDACHSASMVRNAPQAEVRYRHVAPTDLGLPEARLDEALSAATRSRGGTPAVEEEPLGRAGSGGKGGSIFFYAAQTTEVTPEMRLPQDASKRMTYGLFSFMLARGLELGRPLTYRQLAQFVLTQYGGMAEARVTPMFSGTALDLPVLGQQTVPVRQWRASAERLRLPEGRLSDLAPGALLALVPGPEADSRDTVGYYRASEVELTHTDIVPVAHAGRPAPKPADLKPGSYWRLVANPVRYSLRVSVDERDCRSNCPWSEMLGRIKAGRVEGADIEWVGSGADIVLQLSRDRIVVLPPSAQGEVACASAKGCGGHKRPLGTTLLVRSDKAGHSAEAELRGALHAIAKSTNLLRLATRLSSLAPARGLKVGIEVQRRGRPAREPVSASQVPRLQPGDRLVITLGNEGNKPLDVTLLYADARYGIGALFPSSSGELNRLVPGATLTIADIQISDSDGVFGIERLLAISVEAEKHAERADFSFLSQPPLKDALQSRGGAGVELMQDFLDAAYPGNRADSPTDTRSRGQPTRATAAGGAGMQVFTLNVQPAR